MNTGVYCFDARWLWQLLPEIPLGASGETYLTDMVVAIVARGERVADVVARDPSEAIGINNRIQLSRAEAVLRQRVRERLMLDGVTLVDPASIFVDADVRIGRDSVVYPGTIIAGASRIGARCTIGPSTLIADSTLGDGCRILHSVVENARLEDDVSVGPFGHLRAGSYLGRAVHLGNFVEVKNSSLGAESRMGHFSYLGDATLGQRVNVGAGTITCNYDGVNKHRTVLGDGVFVGSDTQFIAPVTVGRGSYIGAGSSITDDVPPDSLAIARARQVTKAGYMKKRKAG